MKTKKKSSKGAAAATAIKPVAGKATKESEFNPSDQTAMAMAANLQEIREPRPYLSRYPIPEEEFRRLKEKSANIKLALGKTTLSKDTGGKMEISATAAPFALEAASAEPAAAPNPAGHFGGINATGWIPPDCTMATGPNHVALSVNSTLAIYNKTGGPAVLQRTLTAWFSNVIQGATIFDPKLLFDQHAGRWVLLAVAVSSTPKASAYPGIHVTVYSAAKCGSERE